MKPLVSILIPAYNAEPYIEASIRSALDQSWPEKEVIVVDDGSKDATASVAERYEGKGVRLFRRANGGAAAARNYAYEQSRGDYIQWLDADDLLSPGKVAAQMEVLLQAGSEGMLASSPWGRFMHRPSRARFVATSLWCDLTPAEWMLRKMKENLHMQTATWLTSRVLSGKAGPWNGAMLSDDDGEYFSRVLLASEGVKFVPEGKVYYRVTPTSRLSYIGNSDRKREAMLGSMKLHVERMLTLEDSERAREACLCYLHNWLIYFYPERGDLVSELEELAAGLGGVLTMPGLRWKYAWLVPLLGWEKAKQAQFLLPNLRESVMMRLDQVLLRLEEHGLKG